MTCRILPTRSRRDDKRHRWTKPCQLGWLLCFGGVVAGCGESASPLTELPPIDPAIEASMISQRDYDWPVTSQGFQIAKPPRFAFLGQMTQAQRAAIREAVASSAEASQPSAEQRELDASLEAFASELTASGRAPSTALAIQWMHDGRLEELDAMGELLRQYGGRRFGFTAESLFRDLANAVGDQWAAVEAAKTDPERLDKLEAWRHNGGVVALCASTYRHIRLGWQARGSGTSETVSNQGWGTFAAHLRQAEQDNERALNLARPPAVAFSHRMQLAMGQGWPIDEQEPVIQRAFELHPTDSAVHEAVAYWLLPRWGGTHGESSGYAAAIADLVGGAEGDRIYMECAATLYNKFPTEIYYSQTRFDFQRMQRGIDFYLREPPADRKRLTRLLQIARDREDAATAERIAAVYASYFGTAP